MDWLAGDGDGADADAAANVRLLETLEAAPCTLLLNAFCALSRYEDIFCRSGMGASGCPIGRDFGVLSRRGRFLRLRFKVAQIRVFDAIRRGGDCIRSSSLHALKLEKLACGDSKSL